jgi:hypothetical protein
MDNIPVIDLDDVGVEAASHTCPDQAAGQLLFTTRRSSFTLITKFDPSQDSLSDSRASVILSQTTELCFRLADDDDRRQ